MKIKFKTKEIFKISDITKEIDDDGLLLYTIKNITHVEVLKN